MSLSFAIVGCGRIARRHAEQILRVGKLLAVCDIDQAAVSSFAAEFNAIPYLSIPDLLLAETQVDVVCVCTPNGLHAQHSILSLQAGKHVLCEKPLSISSKDGHAMIQASLAAKRKLYVVKQNRFNPPVQKLKELITKDQLGRILSFQLNCFWNRPDNYYKDTWRGTKNLDGGALFTQFSHFIDLLYWCLGDVKTIQAIVRNYDHPQNETDDSGVVIFEMQSGVTGTLNYNVNSFQKNMEGSFTVFGNAGTVKVGGQYLNEIDYHCIAGDPSMEMSAGKPANDYGLYMGSMSNHDKVYDQLVRSLCEPGYEFINPLDGLKTVEIIEKIYASSSK